LRHAIAKRMPVTEDEEACHIPIMTKLVAAAATKRMKAKERGETVE
jgi:hypothetical protein